MSHGHTLNGAHATGGVITADQAYVPEHPAPFVVPEGALPQTASHVPAGAHLLPSGNWVRLGDPHAITRGDKRLIVAAVKADDINTPAEIGFAIADVLLTKLVIEWSYPLSLPSADPASLDAIPGCDDEPLSELIRPTKELLFPGLATPDQHDDPNSPTAPSGA